MHSLDVTLYQFFFQRQMQGVGGMTLKEQKDLLTIVFSDLGNKPPALSLDQINLLEKFVFEIYAVRKVDSLTQARLDKFLMSIDNDLRILPPRREALIHHKKQACYQAGYLWRDLIDNLDPPDPRSWGWEKKTSNGNYDPLWESTQINRNEFETFIRNKFFWIAEMQKV